MSIEGTDEESNNEHLKSFSVNRRSSLLLELDRYSIPLSHPLVFSKLLITGPLSPTMPYIVLSELALERRFIVEIDRMIDPLYYIKVFKKISKIDPPYICDLNDKQNFTEVIYIVNPFMKDKWNINTLQNAFCFLNYFKYLYREEKDYPFFTFTPVGLQTPENPFNINACIYYGISRFKNIHIPLDVTYEELKHKVIMSLLPSPRNDTKLQSSENIDTSQITIDNFKDSPKRIIDVEIFDDSEEDCSSELFFGNSEILNQDSDPSEEMSPAKHSISSDKTEIIQEEQSEFLSGLGMVSKEGFQFFDNFNTIEMIGECFQDLQYVRNQFYPLNDEQAIVASAIVKHRDLSKMKRPLEDFKYYQNYTKTKDTQTRNYEIKNPHFIDLHMYFNPYLPKILYDKRNLEHHLQLFSYPSYMFAGIQPYEILQEFHLEENFYLGWHPTIINLETPIDLDVVSELKNQQIVCYGIRDEKMNATTWKELYSLFKNMNLFINPFEKNNIFTTNKIERLNKLGKWILSPPIDHKYLFLDYEEDTLNTIREFVDLIDMMLLFQKSEFEMFREYSIQYQSMNEIKKYDIKVTLEKLFEVVMFMRGWKVGQPYPISFVPASNNDITEKNTLEALTLLDELNERSNHMIYSLPLIIWKNEFVKCQSEDQGLTVGERIAIVKNGESDNINSCIRMTSNVLGASYCFYCKLFKIPENFDIKDLTYIQ